jgi:hypothetical protein
MRFSRRVVQTGALIRDRSAGVVKSATRARRQRIPSSAYATPYRFVARTPKSIRDPHRPISVTAIAVAPPQAPQRCLRNFVSNQFP